jgi:hypothetical protein
MGVATPGFTATKPPDNDSALAGKMESAAITTAEATGTSIDFIEGSTKRLFLSLLALFLKPGALNEGGLGEERRRSFDSGLRRSDGARSGLAWAED